MGYIVSGDLDISRFLFLGQLTTAQRDANSLGALNSGAVIWNTDDTELQVWNGTSWDSIVPGIDKQGIITSTPSSVVEGIYTLDANTAAYDFILPTSSTTQRRIMLLGKDVETNNVTVKVPSGERLNNIVDGTFTVSKNGGMYLIVERFTGYWDITFLNDESSFNTIVYGDSLSAGAPFKIVDNAGIPEAKRVIAISNGLSAFTTSSAIPFTITPATNSISLYEITNNRILAIAVENSVGFQAIIGTPSAGVITWGTPSAVYNAVGSASSFTSDVVGDSAIVAAGISQSLITIDASGTIPTFSNIAVASSGNIHWVGYEATSNSNIRLITFSDSTGDHKALLHTVNTNSLSTPVSILTTGVTDAGGSVVPIGGDRFALNTIRTGIGNYITILSISGSTINFGTPVSLGVSNTGYIESLGIDKFIIKTTSGISVYLVSSNSITLSGNIFTGLSSMEAGNGYLKKIDDSFVLYAGPSEQGVLNITDTNAIVSAGTTQSQTISYSTNRPVAYTDAYLYASSGTTNYASSNVDVLAGSPAADIAGFVLETLSAGTTGRVAYVGDIAGIFSGLIPGTDYYFDSNNGLSNITSEILAGKAISSTELLVELASVASSAGLAKQGAITSDPNPAKEGVYTLNASAGPFNFTLPSATGSQTRIMLSGVNVATNNVTVKVQTGERLNSNTNGQEIISSNGALYLAIDRATGDWDITQLNDEESTNTIIFGQNLNKGEPFQIVDDSGTPKAMRLVDEGVLPVGSLQSPPFTGTPIITIFQEVDSNSVMAAATDGSNFQIVVGDISGNNITWGTATSVAETSALQGFDYNKSLNIWCASFGNTTVRYGQVSGNTVTNINSFTHSETVNYSAFYQSSVSNKYIMAYNGAGDQVRVCYVDVSIFGAPVITGTMTVLPGPNATGVFSDLLDIDKVIITTGATNGASQAIVIKATPTTDSFILGTPFSLTSAGYGTGVQAVDASTAMVYYTPNSTSNGKMRFVSIDSSYNIAFAGNEYTIGASQDPKILFNVVSMSRMIVIDSSSNVVQLLDISDKNYFKLLGSSQTLTLNTTSTQYSNDLLVISDRYVLPSALNNKDCNVGQVIVASGVDSGIVAGFVVDSAAAGDIGKIAYPGDISPGHTNLQTGKNYFFDDSGSIVLTPGLLQAGKAISSTELLVELDYSPVSVNSVSEYITQSAHGFIPGQAIYLDDANGKWTLADASDPTSLAIGVVSATPDTNTFVITYSGIIELPALSWDAVTSQSGGLSQGDYYYTSDTTPGGITPNEPPLYSNPVLFASSATTAAVIQYRPSAVITPSGTNYALHYMSITSSNLSSLPSVATVIGSGYNVIDIDSSVFDVVYDVNNLRIVADNSITITQSGKYRILFDAGNGNDNATYGIYVNGTRVSAAGNNNTDNRSVEVIMDLQVAQKVEFGSDISTTFVSPNIILQQLPISSVIASSDIPLNITNISDGDFLKWNATSKQLEPISQLGTLRSVVAVETKSANYTVVKGDFGKYLKFTSGIPTMGSVLSDDVGKIVYIRNQTGSDLTVLSEVGVTINGFTTISNHETLSIIAVGVNQYDATGGK